MKIQTHFTIEEILKYIELNHPHNDIDLKLMTAKRVMAANNLQPLKVGLSYEILHFSLHCYVEIFKSQNKKLNFGDTILLNEDILQFANKNPNHLILLPLF